MPFKTSRITTVLVVPSIEPSLGFWVDKLGFEKTVEVPHEDALGFAILVKNDLELMFQTEASVRADLGGGAAVGTAACLFLEVDDLSAVEAALKGYPVAMSKRTTFYGMHEFGVVEPGGHWVTFAQKA